MTTPSIGIIGYGDFSKLLIQWLSPYATIYVHSRSRTEGDAGYGAHFAPLSDVLSQPIIIPSIPSQYFDSFFSEHKTLINPQALLIDVCSVKVRPLESLLRLLPSSCQIIGTHPLLGPASVAINGGLTGLRCAVTQTRVTDETYKQFVDFLHGTLGLIVLEVSPEQHDKDMAYVQGLSHYIGHAMSLLDIPQTDLATMAYEDLLKMKAIQGNDSWDLFLSIMNENPYAKEVHESFQRAMKTLDSKLD